MHLASGLSVGLAGIAAGYTIGVVGDAVSNSTSRTVRLLVIDFSRVSVLTCNNHVFMLE